VEKAYSGRIKLLLLDVTKVFEEFLPAFTEQPRLIATAPALLELIGVHRLEAMSHHLAKA
jgi:hypothetical protein